MKKSHLLPCAEQRLLYFSQSSEQQSRVEEALDSMSTATKRPVSATNIGQELDRLNTWAATEVKNVKPSISGRIGRFLLTKSASTIGYDKNFYDATTAEVASSIDRQAYQRMRIAEKQLNDHEHNALEDVRSLSRKTKLSSGFLRHKVEICERLKTDLNQELSYSQQRLSAAKNVRSFDRGQLKNSVRALQEKISAVQKIGGDTNKQLEGSMVGQMHHDIDQAVKYFTDTCAAYLPQSASNVRAMIQEYIQGDATDLEGLMEELAQAMHPDDTKQQKAQISTMKRIAEKMTGEQSRWRALRRRMSDVVIPGVAAGTIGAFTGGIGWAAMLAASSVGAGGATRVISNAFRFGTASKRDFEKSQAASYFNSMALREVQLINDLKATKTLQERMDVIADVSKLPNGSKMKVEKDGSPITLTLGSIRNGARLATSTTGDHYSLDVQGVSGGSGNAYIVAIKTLSSNGKPEIKKLDAIQGSSSDSILSIS